jgi:hypothetical protein
MLDTPLLRSVARQMMGGENVEIEGKRFPVRRTSRQGLRTVAFGIGERSWKTGGSEGRDCNWIGRPFEETVPGG